MMTRPNKRGELAWHEFIDGKWAITKPVYRTIQHVLWNRMNGAMVSESEREAARSIKEAREREADARRETAAAVSAGAVYVVPVSGVITQHASELSAWSGGCSCDEVLDEVRRAMEMTSVSAVVLDINSPGGSCYGVMETFDALKAMRGKKPLVAFCDPIAASAAYWLASACDSIYCTPSGEAGSVGVYAAHHDYSSMNEKLGIVVTYIYAGRYKVEGNEDAALSDEAKAYFQKVVDETYGEFVSDVAAGRGVATKDVIDRFGEGRCLLAKDALAAGLVDEICTFEEVIQKVSGSSPKKNSRRGLVSVPSRAAAAMEPNDEDGDETCAPLEDGTCPDGYELDEEKGVCRISRAKEPAPTTDAPPAEDDATATAVLRDRMAASASAMDMERRRQ